MSDAFVIEPLGRHDRSCFSSGVIPLDRYLREQASQDVRRNIASCFVAVEMATSAIAGYYTLAATSVQATDLPPDILKRLPRYASLPAALVGRLAVDQRFQRRRLGGALLTDGALRVIKGDLKAFILVVDAKDDNAAAFYQHQEFRPLISRPRSFFVPLATVGKGRREDLESSRGES
jgi:ribosomal protein S18 acetylase RimI-like enzyme